MKASSSDPLAPAYCINISYSVQSQSLTQIRAFLFRSFLVHENFFILCRRRCRSFDISGVLVLNQTTTQNGFKVYIFVRYTFTVSLSVRSSVCVYVLVCAHFLSVYLCVCVRFVRSD